MTASTRLLCRPWAELADLPDEADRPVDLDDDAWTALLTQASGTLYAFSGRQFDGGGCASTVVLDSPPGQRCGGARWTPVGEAAVDTLAGPRPARWARGQVVVLLPGPPVTSVDEVVIGSDPVDYGWHPSGRIWLTDGRPWPLDGTAAVTYQHGIAPPLGGRRSAVLLALELAKARAGHDDCRLPERVSTITREGVTVGMLDSFEHLDKLQTGLYEVDLWLAEVNPHRFTRRPSVWSPDMARTRRRTP